MYNFIRGHISDIEKDSIVIDNSGIGYLIHTTHPYDYQIGQQVTFHTFYQVKEDSIALYGFPSKDERNIFLKLINVKGIGPKMALNILSGTDVASFVDALDRGDITFLKRLPGIGPKSAQQLIVELRGRFDLMEKGIAQVNSKPLSDARAGLVALGFKPTAVDEVLSSLRGQTLTTQEYIKKALVRLKQ